jgi:hypothetical protein
MTEHPITCASCGARMADDQRYCLNCGQRRGEPRLDFLALLRGGEPESSVSPAPPARGIASVLPTPRVAAACILVVLGFGVILGAAGTAPLDSSFAAARRSLTIVLPPVRAVAPKVAATPAPPAEPAPSASAAPAPSASAPEPAAPAPAPDDDDTPVTNDDDDTPTGPEYPAIKHVWIVALAGHTFDQTYGPDSTAPYLSKELTTQGTLLTGYKTLSTGGLANSIALVSGQKPNTDTEAGCTTYAPVDPGTVDDDGQAQGHGCVYSEEVYTLPDQLVAGGSAWKAYVEGIGTPCRHPDAGTADPWQQPRPDDPYVTRRNPFVYFTTITSSPDCENEVVGTDALGADLADKAKTPSLSFVIPSPCHDGSDTPCAEGAPAGLAAADAWLKDTIGRITASPAYRKDGLIVIAADGSDPAAPGDGRIGALLLSKFVEKGGTFDTEYDQLSLLKTLGAIFGLRDLGAAQDEDVKPFDESLFASSSQDVHDSATRR